MRNFVVFVLAFVAAGVVFAGAADGSYGKS